jgi:hypothetical protein
MKQSSDLNSVKETGDHSKNEANQKSTIMDKRNFLRNICYASWVVIGIILFTGCNYLGDIGMVKRSILSDLDHSITIGDALENYKYFKKTEWTNFTTEQGRKIVEFRGYYTKWDAVVTIQFVLNVDLHPDREGLSFKVGHVGMTGTNRHGKEDTVTGRYITLRYIYNNHECIGERENDVYDTGTFKDAHLIPPIPPAIIKEWPGGEVLEYRHNSFNPAMGKRYVVMTLCLRQ